MALSRGFPRVGPPTTLPFGVRTFLERRFSLRRPRLSGQQRSMVGQRDAAGTGRAAQPAAASAGRGCARGARRATAPSDPHTGQLGRPVGAQALPDAVEPLLEREPAAAGAVGRAQRRVRPADRARRSRTSSGRSATAGLMRPSSGRRPPCRAPSPRCCGWAPAESFSGWSLTWSDSLKKRLTVASDSPTSATTISPFFAVSCERTTTWSLSWMPALIIESPLMARTNSPSSPPASSGTCTYSSMFSSASTGRAGGDLADDGKAPADHRVGRLLRPVDQQLDGARLGRVAAQQPDLLEVREVRVHGRRRGEPDRLADVAHGGRVAVLRRVLLDEVEDLLLALGEVQIGHSAPLSGGLSLRVQSNMCS